MKARSVIASFSCIVVLLLLARGQVAMGHPPAGAPEAESIGLPAVPHAGEAWASLIAGGGMPEAVYGHTTVYDGADRRMVVFGDIASNGSSTDDLWAMQETNPKGKIAFVSRRGSNAQIYVMNTDGTGATNVTGSTRDDMWPDWSPDGQQIAFSRDGDIWVMNADGTGQWNLTNSPANGQRPAWSPDGSQIAFAAEYEGNLDIYVINTDRSGLHNLTQDPAIDYYPDWSPDGSQIAFTTNRNGNFETYVMNANGTGATNRTNNPATDLYPTWLPDGQRLTFLSDREGGYKVFIMNADGTGQARFTQDVGDGRGSTWSPDGQWAAVTSGDSGNLDIYLVQADGKGAINLTANPAQDQEPSWQPPDVGLCSITGRVADAGGNAIPGVEISSSLGQVATTNASGTYTLTELIAGTYILTPTLGGYTFAPPTRTVSVPPSATQRDFSAVLSEESIIFSSDRDLVPGQWNLYTMNPDGGSVRRLTYNSAGGDAMGAFSPDGRQIVFCRGYGWDYTQIRIMDVATGDPDNASSRLLWAPNPQDRVAAPRWSPDGTRILFSQGQHDDEDLYLTSSDGSGTPQRLTTGCGADRSADFSPDGRTIAFASAGGGCGWELPGLYLYLMDADGSNIRAVLNPEGQRIVTSDVRWSPDASDLLIDAPGGLAAVHPDGSGYHLVASGQPFGTFYAWSPDGLRVARSAPGVGGAGDVWVSSSDGTGTPVNITSRAGDDYLWDWHEVVAEGYSISGQVSDARGDGSARVVLSAGVGYSATTDASGTYTLTGLIAGTYTLTPTLSDYVFTPPTRTVSVPPDAVGQDFASIPADFRVRVLNDGGQPMVGARVYRNGAFAGQTRADGVLEVASLSAGDELVTLAPLPLNAANTPGGTGRTGHDGDLDSGALVPPWAFQVFLTNLHQSPDMGPLPPDPLPDGAPGERVLVVYRDSSLVLLNLTVSVEWDADRAYLDDLAAGFRSASAFLYDVSDGQMALGRVTLYENSEHWGDADVRIAANNLIVPYSAVEGISSGRAELDLRLGPWWNGHSARRQGEDGPWSQPAGYRTIVHELGHYVLGLYDEYVHYTVSPEGVPEDEDAFCTHARGDPGAPLEPNRASIMDNQHLASELADRLLPALWSQACEDTEQWDRTGGESDWDTLLRRYGAAGGAALSCQVGVTTTASYCLWRPGGRDHVLPQAELDFPTERGWPFPVVDRQSSDDGPPLRRLVVQWAGVPQGERPDALRVVAQDTVSGQVRYVEQGMTGPDGTLEVLGARDGATLWLNTLDRSVEVTVPVSALLAITVTLQYPQRPEGARTRSAATPRLELIPQADGRGVSVEVSGTMREGLWAEYTLRGEAPRRTPLTRDGSLWTATLPADLRLRASGTVQIVDGQGRALGSELSAAFAGRGLPTPATADVYSPDGRLWLHLPEGSVAENSYVVMSCYGALPGDWPGGWVLGGPVYAIRYPAEQAAPQGRVRLRIRAEDLATRSGGSAAILGQAEGQADWRVLAGRYVTEDESLSAKWGAGMLVVGWAREAVYLPMITR